MATSAESSKVWPLVIERSVMDRLFVIHIHPIYSPAISSQPARQARSKQASNCCVPALQETSQIPKELAPS
ncbi:chromosome segregation protein [Aspergillus luchuensis]|uniref:Chromosome segregation protein n=1 Tax=Aspergillus kawachii TaxID=1069201 RepID=A0A146F3X5_ASPKA|nr:chromosome segregation protein [Aspergillus luchuensis]